MCAQSAYAAAVSVQSISRRQQGKEMARQPPSQRLARCYRFQPVECVRNDPAAPGTPFYLRRQIATAARFALNGSHCHERLMTIYDWSRPTLSTFFSFRFKIFTLCAFGLQDNSNLYIGLEVALGGEMFAHLRRLGRFRLAF